MKRRHKILLALVACHMALVICGAASFRIPGDNPLSKVLRGYSAASGADSGYGFFAPGVGSQFRFSFTMTDEQGNQWNDDLRFGTSQEANLRLTGMANYLSQSNAGHRYLVMQSLAAKMFARHPGAKTVTVQYQMWGAVKPGNDPKDGPVVNLPRMNEIRAGAKPKWLTFEMYAFTRGQQAADNAPFRFTFTLADQDGKTWSDQLTLQQAQLLRLPNTDGADMSLQKDRDRVLQALALEMLNRHPAAAKVTVTFQFLESAAKSSDANAKSTSNVKPEWKTLEEQTFAPAKK